MPDEDVGHSWTGIDGVRYNSKTVTDSHLRFYHRMLIEKQPEEEARCASDPTPPLWAVRRLERCRARIAAVEEELALRRLTPFAPRTPEQVAQAAQRRAQRQQAPQVTTPTLSHVRLPGLSDATLEAIVVQTGATPLVEYRVVPEPRGAQPVTGVSIGRVLAAENRGASSSPTPRPPRARTPKQPTTPPDPHLGTVPLTTERYIRLPPKKNTEE